MSKATVGVRPNSYVALKRLTVRGLQRRYGLDADAAEMLALKFADSVRRQVQKGGDAKGRAEPDYTDGPYERLKAMFADNLQRTLEFDSETATHMAARVVEVICITLGGRDIYFLKPSSACGSTQVESSHGNSPADARQTPVSPNEARRRKALQVELPPAFVAVLCKHFDLDEAAASSVAVHLCAWMEEELAGQHVYFCQDAKRRRHLRDLEIFERMQRGTASDLVAEFGLSYVRLHQIVRQVRADLRRKGKELDASAPSQPAVLKASEIEPLPPTNQRQRVAKKTSPETPASRLAQNIHNWEIRKKS